MRVDQIFEQAKAAGAQPVSFEMCFRLAKR